MQEDEFRELVRLLGTRLISRKDVKAIQVDDGGYRPVYESWRMSDFAAHLDGTKTFGHYTVAPEGTTKFFAFDIDLRKEFGEDDRRPTALHGRVIDPRSVWQTPAIDMSQRVMQDVLGMEMRCLAEGFASRVFNVLGLPVAVTYTGAKGMHVYGFTPEPVPADQARAVGVTILEALGFVRTKGKNFWMHEFEYDCFELELFPKQDSVEGKEKQLGNLISLPLGKHRRTRAHKFFVALTNTHTDGFLMADPWQVLNGVSPWDPKVLGQGAMIMPVRAEPEQTVVQATEVVRASATAPPPEPARTEEVSDFTLAPQVG